MVGVSLTNEYGVDSLTLHLFKFFDLFPQWLALVLGEVGYASISLVIFASVGRHLISFSFLLKLLGILGGFDLHVSLLKFSDDL